MKRKPCQQFVLALAFMFIFLQSGLEVIAQNAFESVPNDPLNAKIYTLDNGLKLYVSENHNEPRVYTAIAVRAGSKNDPADVTGLAHYLEHMVFKGNSQIGTMNWEKEKVLLQEISDLYEKHRNTSNAEEKLKIYQEIDRVSQEASKFAIANEYDKMISSLGAKGTNAFTSVEQTVYINDIPANELDKWMHLESSRFSELVLRLFHTELEAVYEEFNRVQDNDSRKIAYAMMGELYKKHPYGTQTTIGKGEHLKNPSMVKIHEYFNSYYIPNNIAICISGDVNADEVYALAKKHFGGMKTKEVPKFSFQKEEPIAAPIVKEVFGPSAESVSIGYRSEGVHSDNALKLDIISNLLYNGKAGLIDINLNNSQKVLQGYAFASVMEDYSSLRLYGSPREGQSLDEVRALLLAQVEKLKKGEFEDWMVSAIINNIRLEEMKSNESNNSRAMQMANAFVTHMDWKDVVASEEKMKKFTKADIVAYANEILKDNYVVVNKKQGEDKSVFKVDKPKITPIELNRDAKSAFLKSFEKMSSTELQPMWVDYKGEIKQKDLKPGLSFNYINNKENDLFSLYYILDMGSDNDKKLDAALSYLEYLGTSKYSSEELKKEMYKLGLSYEVYSSEDRTYVTLKGLKDSFEKGVELFEHLLSEAKPDAEALNLLVDGILKQRQNMKANKGIIQQGAMADYAKYGPDSRFKYVLSEEELKALKGEELVSMIKKLTSYKHKVFYYGSEQMLKVEEVVTKLHKTPETLSDYPTAKKYTELKMTKNLVYVVDYDMVQAEILAISKVKPFTKEELPISRLFNEFFGSGLSSIVFQEIRESKALAYSANCSYSTPPTKDESHYLKAYVGTQVDKLPVATKALMDLMNNMPEATEQFNDSRESALKLIESERITKEKIFFNYDNLQKLGIDYDIRKENYEKLKNISITDMKAFFDQNIKGRNYTFLVIGKKSSLDMKALNELGEVKELTLQEIFGY